MAETTNQTYLSLITQAISDFDSIYGALVERGVATYGTLSGTTYETGVATSAYADLVRKLYKVTDKNSNEVSLGTHDLEYKDTLTATSISVNAQSGLITLTPGAVAVIGGTTTVTYTLTPVSITDTNLGKDETNGVYKYVTENDKLIKDVTIAAGKIELDIEKAEVSSWEPTVQTTTMAPGNQLGADILKNELAEGETGYTSFTVAPTVNVTGSKTVTLSAGKGFSFTKGYIENVTATDLEKEISTSGTFSPDASTLYIKNATLTNVVANGEIDFTSNDITSVADSVAGYNISADAALTVSGDVQPGYLSAGTELKSDKATDINKVFRVKAGHTNPVTLENTLTVSGDKSILAPAGATDVYEITVTSSAIDETKSVEYGFIKSTDANFKVTAGEESETLKIAAGSVEAKAKTSLVSVNGTGASKTEGANNTTEAIQVTVQAVFDADEQTTSAGYITTSDVTRTAAAASTYDIHLTKSTVTEFKNNLVATPIDIDENGDAEGNYPAQVGGVNIFTDAAPTDRDYYHINSYASYSISAGYTSTGLTGNTSKDLYLPKAKLAYVEDSEAGKILQVTSGGYLPSGFITELSEITGSLDHAKVYTTLTAPAYDAAKGKYIINAVYNENSEIGYFNGAADFYGGSYELTKGLATQVASIDETVLGEDGIVANGNKYTVNLTTTGKTKTTITTGYITGSDVTVNGSAVANESEIQLTGETSIELNKATLGLSAKAVDLAATPTGFAFADGQTAYKITPNFGENYKVTIAPTAEGYVKTTDTTEVTLVSGTVQEYYLKAGSVDAITAVAGNSPITLTADFATNESGDYSVQIPTGTTVAATATIHEGYVKGDTPAAGNVAVSSNVLKVDRGSITPTITEVTTAISSTQVALSTSNTEENETFYAIKSNASATSSATVSKVGYVKQVDVDDAATANATEDTQYVKGVKLNVVDDTTVAAGKVYSVSGFGVDSGNAVDSQVISTAERYAKYDVKVELHADAMGSNVRSELARLQARLAGSNVTATVSVQ